MCDDLIKEPLKYGNYEGYRIIEGKTKLKQTIYFENLQEHDQHRYSKNETKYMLTIANQIFRNLIGKNHPLNVEKP